VVPHPDDEVLMFGGLIDLQRRRGVTVHVVAVSDGEAANDDAAPLELAEIRRAEQAAALSELAIHADDVVRLGLPDGGVAGHEDVIADAVSRFDDALVVAPWNLDHHTDHEACGRGAELACASSGAALYSGIFWAWQHTDPDRLVHERMIQLRLVGETAERRRAALAHHRSQLSGPDAILDEQALVPLSWDAEYYLAATEPLGLISAEDTEPTDSLIRPGRGLER
jgi:LmbE family N-acetylglucosaminyl deacetylase